MKTPQKPDTRLIFELAPYYAHHQHTPRYRRQLPWETAAIEIDASHIYLDSGDRNYEAALFMSGGRLCAVVNRVYASRKDRLAFYGHNEPDYMDHLKRTVIHERLTMLFGQYSQERIAEVIHAALGTHSQFCTSTCAYPDLREYRKAQRDEVN
jgi:hypothetical protein